MLTPQSGRLRISLLAPTTLEGRTPISSLLILFYHHSEVYRTICSQITRTQATQTRRTTQTTSRPRTVRRLLCPLRTPCDRVPVASARRAGLGRRRHAGGEAREDGVCAAGGRSAGGGRRGEGEVRPTAASLALTADYGSSTRQALWAAFQASLGAPPPPADAAAAAAKTVKIEKRHRFAGEDVV